MIRQRGGATRRRNDQDEGPNSSAQEIGLLLREAREERGLDLLAVHDRLSRPITQLEALERGTWPACPTRPWPCRPSGATPPSSAWTAMPWPSG